MLRKPLIHRHKLAARLLLYLSPLLFVGSVWGVIEVAGRLGLEMSWRGTDYSKHEEVRLLQEYLRIDTSYPDGNEIAGAELLARQLESWGIAAHVERLGHRNANLWAVVEGEERGALVLHNHLDVEPVRPGEKWRHPPFGGVLDPPFVYGRGAFDMKSYAIAQLLAMRAIHALERPPRRSLVFLATAEEEIDSRLGTVWLLREHPELVARFEAILTEGGAIEAVTLDDVKYWGTEFSQKRFVDVWVCDARRERLEGLRDELLAVDPELRPPAPAIAEFLGGYGPTRDRPEIRDLLRRPERLASEPAARELPPYLKAMLRNEVEPFPVEEDPGGGYRMRVILHLLPGVEVDEAFAELLPGRLETFTYSIDEPHDASASSPLDHPVYRTIDRTVRELRPGAPHGPLFLPWSATDARFFRAAGIPTYGFSPFLLLSTDAQKMKGANERMPAPAFLEGVELYVELVRRLVLDDEISVADA